jgi:hypothetical protein
MKISELISELEILKSEKGDLEVELFNISEDLQTTIISIEEGYNDEWEPVILIFG